MVTSSELNFIYSHVICHLTLPTHLHLYYFFYSIKARERALKKQVQAEYEGIAPVNDIQAQLEGNAESVDQTVLTSGPIRYAFVGDRIAQAFFDSPSAFGVESDVGWRVSIVDDLESLCSLQEGRFRKASQRRRSRVMEYNPEVVDAEYTLNAKY